MTLRGSGTGSGTGSETERPARPQALFSENVQDLVRELEARSAELEAQGGALCRARHALAVSEARCRELELGLPICEREQGLRRHLDAIPLLVSYVDADQRYRFNNRAYETWFGVDRARLWGQRVEAVLGVQNYSRIREHIESGLSGRMVCFDSQLNGPDGERWVSVVYSPDRADTGEVRGLYCFVREVSDLKRAQLALRASAAEAALAEERERRCLAADLHDDVGQLLSLAALRASTLSAVRDPEARAVLAEIEALLRQARQRISSLSFQLSPPVLYDVGLRAAAHWLAEDLQRSYALAVQLEEGPELEELDEALRVTLFRALRELLLNVARHARTDRASVGLRRAGEAIHLEVCDAGSGFDAHVGGTGFGLSSLRGRIEHLGGRVWIESRPGAGTRVSISVPLHGILASSGEVSE